MRLAAVAFAALVLTPAAEARTPLGSGVGVTTTASLLVTQAGTIESLAVDSNGVAQIAFYSNADPDGATVYEKLAADLTPGAPVVLKPAAEHEAPLVADRSGNTFLAWAPGYPAATSLSVVPFTGGSPSGDGVAFRGVFSGPEPHLALAVDGSDRLSVVWTQGERVHAARSRTHGLNFGATVTAAEPGTIYHVSAAGVAAGVGTAQVVVNTGTAPMAQAFQPGLSVRVTKKGRAHYAQALDDGFGVAGARFRIGGKPYKANRTGKARVPSGRGVASASGYVSASFRVP